MGISGIVFATSGSYVVLLAAAVVGVVSRTYSTFLFPREALFPLPSEIALTSRTRIL